MSEPDETPQPDGELKDLVSRFLDDRLDSTQRDRLEHRLQHDAEARAYCAGQLRFAAALKESLAPQRIEVVETRRMVLEKGTALVEQNRSVRYGDESGDALGLNPRAAASRSRTWAWAAAAASGLLILGVLAWPAITNRKSIPAATPPGDPPSLQLRNGGFETSDLSLSPRGLSDLLEDWGDGVRPAKVQLMEISRVTGGKTFAKSGKNVAFFQYAGSINQRLQRADGSVITAREGIHVKVEGWAYAEAGTPGLIDCGLRFIASGRPDMLLYEAAGGRVEVTPGSWQPFSFDLKITGNLMRPPYSSISPPPAGPMLDLTGRDLYLAIVSRCRATLLVDDLRIVEIIE